MPTDKSKTIEFWQLSVLSSLVCICNCFFYSNRMIMYIVVGIEVLWLFTRLATGKLLQYYCHYVVFMALSLEFPEFVGIENFYGFKSIGLGSINIGVLMILPLLFRLLMKGKIIIGKNGILDKFFRNFSFLVIAALLLGFVHWMFNDNGIGNYATMSTFFSYMYLSVYIYLCFLTFYLLSKEESFRTDYIENVLFSIIVAVAVTMLASFLLSNYGIYGGVRTLQICNLNMTLPCCVMIFIYKDINIERRIPVFVSSIVLSILSLMFNANGKLVLSLGVTFLFILIALFRRNRIAFIITVMAIPLFIFLGVKALEQLGNKSFLLSLKVEQALSLVGFWRSGWLDNISQSPQFRIQEFMTVASEYLKKPWDLFFGKGYMGSTLDNLGYFSVARDTTFSQFELTNHIYISMHETLNSIFLMSGLYGLYFYFKYLLKNIRSVSITFWCVIGAFWFGLFFNYSVTIASFGITAFSLALTKIDHYYEAKSNAN